MKRVFNCLILFLCFSTPVIAADRFEYRCEVYGKGADIDTAINVFGVKGWELVSAVNQDGSASQWCFKRKMTTDLSDKKLAEEFWEKGNKALSANQWDAAAKNLHIAIALDETLIKAHRGLANTYWKWKKNKKACIAYRDYYLAIKENTQEKEAIRKVVKECGYKIKDLE